MMLAISLFTPLLILGFFFYWATQAQYEAEATMLRKYGVGIALLVFVLHWIGLGVMQLAMP